MHVKIIPKRYRKNAGKPYPRRSKSSMRKGEETYGKS